MPCNCFKSNVHVQEYKDLLVFGYASTIFPNDYQSEHIAEERHTVPCLGDPENRVDRYDCRLLLPSIDVAIKRNGSPSEQCPTEAMEEDMCEEERYLDMYKDIQREQEKEEEEKRRNDQRNAIGFDYGTGKVKARESDSEDEPFEPPEGIKFPVGLELPSNMKLHHIIEKTASFIVANGTQMEIVIKAKQRNNAEQFGFLEFDHRLNPFYKYLQKLIREKKYIPDLNKRPKKLTKTSRASTSKPAISSSLAAIAAAHGSDSEDSDSDYELHPSLLSGGAKRPVTPEKPGAIGPRKKPVEPEKPPDFTLKPVGDISQRNDVYAALFKNLAHVTRQAAGVEEVKMNVEEAKKEKENDHLDDPEYREWYENFYGRPCPWIGPRPMIPATPDLEPILNSYAEHVAQRGLEAEASLAAREDLQLHFMEPKSPYYSYYHHKVRMHQWRMYQPIEQNLSPLVLNSPAPPSAVSSPGPSSLMSLNLSTPEPPLNRRQRRRLLDSSRLDESITEPGVIDPITMLQIPKSVSTPANLDILKTPISFSLRNDEPRDESSFRFDPDLDETAGPSDTTANFSDISGLFPPPTPPVIPPSTQMQVDRKEKARIFMEKLLQEKKAKKLQEEEERSKLEEETRKKAEKISESLSERKNTGRSDRREEAPKGARSLDEIINNRINSLLSESGFEPVEEMKRTDEDRERKRHRKRSRSRRRSRSCSPRDRSREHKKSRKSGRHHRSRSRSSSRDRHRRNRSRSRDRRR
ncbi:Protein SWAP [Caenorhabditis elegans]|uniref:Protein SWAP n=1 Tax=Caenorhabditis elegans TaxID=6239 RepID=SWAP_CAEEL|nr:Protein SWAP [Caenorhabditis elegans]Q10580.1 RecName: Full=Protein SWAP; AltName: Full=Suppressor of white apricot protein homolog [Caenorhabditis elegans]AAA64937.1 CeSWAP [Caenorhabditis elegans]CCD61525.1 Protein SWAP [Caenorhabditis elegans]|eukprot:NP_741149.1 Protein SWAP [Caenorhabditis elegans]